MTYDMNYWRDSRVWAASERWWIDLDEGRLRASMNNPESDVEDDDDRVVVWLPIHFEVCGSCDGRGQYVNPAIDADGLTAEDFEEAGEDFRHDYFAGHYDVRCEECEGRRVVPVPDTDDGKRMVDSLLSERHYDDHIEAMERAMGA